MDWSSVVVKDLSPIEDAAENIVATFGVEANVELDFNDGVFMEDCVDQPFEDIVEMCDDMLFDFGDVDDLLET
jgi:hypothetical protein